MAQKISFQKKQYYTLISEFMLQQTQVTSVIPFFNKFVKDLPSIKSLAKVKEKKLMAIKSEISEITKLVSSSTNKEIEDGNIKNIESDTLTLTKIVDNVSIEKERQSLINITEELSNVRKILAAQEIVLKDILLNLKKD